MWSASRTGRLVHSRNQLLGGQSFFVNGFAANDPESDRADWNMASINFQTLTRESPSLLP
jgi:hypothetical protein